MITEINIKNFKSIVDISLNLGRFNVLIGENGCGKSNILEAITYGIAASLKRLDNEYLTLRGIRVTEPEFMKSAFADIDRAEDNLIVISFITDNKKYDFLKFNINPFNQNIANTIFSSPRIIGEEDGKAVLNIDFSGNSKSEFDRFVKYLENALDHFNIDKSNLKISSNNIKSTTEDIKDLNSFMFYCPEESALRTFRDDVQVLPLGRKGEGLFRYLKELSGTEEGRECLLEIKENLSLLDWFDDINIPEKSMMGDYTVYIKDRFINETLEYFDQRSTNEGFLFLLFYITLFVSKDTPQFFAIDNLESSFNPKLCTKITKLLINLAEKHNKQVVITTHSPFILDGLDLSDSQQKLIVVRRNDDGHTKIKEIKHNENRKKKLSEIWMSGAIGGLPDNF